MKKLYKFLIILFSFAIFKSTYPMRRTTTKITAPISSEIKQKVLPRFDKKALQISSQKLKDTVYKTYVDIFHHPLYTNWFEPLYVGMKAQHWGNQIFDATKNSRQFYTDYTMQRAHDQFHKTIYQSWKDRLTPEELLQHTDAINAYENAYKNNYKNVKDLDNQKELLHQTERIYQKIHDHPPLTPKNYESTNNHFAD